MLVPEPTEDDSPIVLTHSEPCWPQVAAPPGAFQVLGETPAGMGIAFKARDPDLGRDLALKVLLDRHRGDQDVVRRFVEEAQIGGQLQHPGIVPVHELGVLRRLATVLRDDTGQGCTLAGTWPSGRARMPTCRDFFRSSRQSARRWPTPIAARSTAT